MREKHIGKILPTPPKEQASLLHTVIDRTLSGLLIFQKEKIVFANPALQQLLGMTATEILGSDPFDFILSEDREKVRVRAFRRLAGLEARDDYHFRIINRYGQTRWVRLLATSIVYLGEPAILAAVIDIDERKRFEDLRSRLLDSLPHPAMLLTKDRIILAANRYAQNLGARVGEYCGQVFGYLSFFNGQHPTADEDVGKISKPGGKTKCDVCMADQALIRKELVKIPNLKGLGKFWDAVWVPVDDHTYLHFAIDVTDREEAELAIQESEQRYRLITEKMSDGLCIQDQNGTIVTVNQRFCEIMGSNSNDIIGLRLTDIIAMEREEAEEAIPARTVLKQSRIEAFLTRKDGRRILVALRIDSLVDDRGRLKGYFAFITDLSDRRMLERRLSAQSGFENIVGFQPCMQQLFNEIEEAAQFDFPVLIQGESGSGKELVARAIHNLSARAKKLFVPVNCAALSEGLLESELFGHVRGAFTGAIRDKKGRFALADGGSIFLDEIAEMSPNLQVKLLRVLQEGAFERVGDDQSIRADVRIISATNKNLERQVAAGKFRQDLYYRLCVMPILVPALRDRRNDISVLVDHFITAIAERHGGLKPSLSAESLSLLLTYPWPGNVRELQNAVQYAYAKSKGKRIEPHHFPPAIQKPHGKTGRRKPRKRRLNRDAVVHALKENKGNKLKAAKVLGVSRATLYRFLDDHPDL